ncbi:MAG: hypothetical protein U1A78_14570 [Polyangia bacterium]
MQTMTRSVLLSLGTCLLFAAGCGTERVPPASVDSRAQADAINGGFETGDLNGWTVTTYLNNSITTFPPMSVANLGLAAGGTNKTYARMGAMPESVVPAGLTAADTLRFPRFGQYSGVVNELGNSNNANRIVQQFTTTQADVDALDGNIHVRFALAPVLENPSHSPNQQPYFYLELRNVTKNSLLFSSFNFSGQAGVPWKNSAAGTNVQYTDWQLFDVAPGPTGIGIGDTLRMDVIAAGCSQGGHYGHLYLDGFGAYIPGLTVVASGPQATNAGTEITYTFVAKNGAMGLVNSVVVSDLLPAGTTFVSVSGATCTTPAVGATGTVSCSLGALNPGAGATFKITVKVDGTATGTINNGSYSIQGQGVSPLIGPLVQTAITSGVVYTDLGIKVSNTAAALDWGSPVTYTVVVTNSGPNPVTGAKLANTLPAQLTGVSWTCTGANGGACSAPSGTGALNTTADLPVGAQVTYTVSGSVVSGTGMGLLSYLVSVSPPTGVSDGNTGNNSAIETDNIGPILALTVDKGQSTGTGTVTSSPTAILCGPSCTTQSAQFLGGSSVTLTAVAATGSTFTGWGGACAAQGTAQQCTVTLSQAQTVSANFSLPSYMITIAIPGGHGTITCPADVVQGRSAECTITPEAGYELDTLRVDGNDLRASVAGTTFTLQSVTGPTSIEGTFKKGLGSGCGEAGECRSGFCTSGVCCESACENGCNTCSAAGTAGTCTPACGNFACNSEQNACYNTCSTDAECVAGGQCFEGSCRAPDADKFVISGGGFSCTYAGGAGAAVGSPSALIALLLALGYIGRRRRYAA